MVLELGEKVHLIERRAFDGDLRRHFIGEVTYATDSVARLKGYVYVLDMATNEYIRRPQIRTRIVPMVDARIIINVLPANANIAKAIYTMDKDRHLCVTDSETFTLDINEFGSTH